VLEDAGRESWCGGGRKRREGVRTIPHFRPVTFDTEGHPRIWSQLYLFLERKTKREGKGAAGGERRYTIHLSAIEKEERPFSSTIIKDLRYIRIFSSD